MNPPFRRGFSSAIRVVYAASKVPVTGCAYLPSQHVRPEPEAAGPRRRIRSPKASTSGSSLSAKTNADSSVIAQDDLSLAETSASASSAKGSRGKRRDDSGSAKPDALNLAEKTLLHHTESPSEILTPLDNPEPSPSTLATPTVLRPYQESAIDACLTAIAAGKTRIGVSSPTGSGKTTMFMKLIPRFPVLKRKGRRKQDDDEGKGVLIIVSSVELANQAEGAAKRLLGPVWSVEVEQSRRSASGIADV